MAARKNQVSGKATYDQPPILRGYTYPPARAYSARDEDRLLSIRLETNHSCNLRCRYCYAHGSETDDVVDYELLRNIVDQASDLGAESIVVIGGGEPTLHPNFRPLIAHIASRGMIPMVFTNTTTMTADLAKFLYDHNASVMGKLDSLKPQLQDYLAGVKGAAARIRAGLENLITAGFCETESSEFRLGVSFVSCRLNLPEIEDIWHFSRKNHIFPNMEVLTPTGRARQLLPDAHLSLDQIKDYKLRLLDIDRRCYNYDWLPYTPLTASGCLQHLYSLYVTTAGNVRPCAPTKFDENPQLFINGSYPHNIFKQPLSRIYNHPLFKYVRNIESRLEGKCKNCPHLDQCIGCRGYAYTVAVNEGIGVLKALRSQCRQCFR